ncbi:HD domain-containing protein [Candidatus Phytoplasma pini]|uniref:HD domain-containing protein n=1 Tax=Candidatus Phytoplasma pini TaxID=267362 RepID=A0A559KJW9_9MOLU|nr:HD domain-containing protein [Candidatus Phytoplasma pini]TVY12388.1 hypothetical protein MDPP_001 [Candidatus Phytoplasma pini]
MHLPKNQFLQEKQIGKKYQLIGKITSINKGENFHNIDLLLLEGFSINVKIKPDFFLFQLEIEKIYWFEVLYLNKNTKNIFISEKYDYIENVLNLTEIYNFYNHFFKCSALSFSDLDQLIQKYLYKIKNPILNNITKNLYFKNQKKFLISPAAFKMHHNYYGGLGFHTAIILKNADALSEVYSFLNRDLLYSGIILHDMAKIQEFDFFTKKYTKEGILLGHLILGVNNIHEEAVFLGFQNSEEVLSLKHLLISHHGLLEYGSIKKPQISEALLLWYLDDIDAKLSTLGDILKNTEKGTFSEPISVLNQKNFYNPDLN